MKRSQKFALLIWLFCMPGTLADTGALQSEIKAYNKADFKTVVKIGTELITQQPGNELARYYLANAYSRLDLIPEAIEQYKYCAVIANDPTIKSYSKQALSVLSNIESAENGANPTHFASIDGEAHQISVDETNQDMQNIKSEGTQLNDQLAEGRDEELLSADYAGVHRVDEINARASSQIALAQSLGGMGYWSGNPSYYNVAAIQYRAQLQADDAKHYFGQVLPWQINKDYNNKRQALNNSISGLQQQLEDGNSSDIELSPQGTNLYVRNYVSNNSNLTPEPPAVTGLRALGSHNKV